jgi:NAD(P)-dependent dehydrogenase (short-subunit alcohol dehydrogenase family)
VLVVGATGRVGRRVVEQLLSQNRPVRALVRNPTKAQELFGKNGSSSMHPNLQVVEADISRFEDFDEVLDKAVEGCGCIISVSGATLWVRFDSGGTRPSLLCLVFIPEALNRSRSQAQGSTIRQVNRVEFDFLGLQPLQHFNQPDVIVYKPVQLAW